MIMMVKASFNFGKIMANMKVDLVWSLVLFSLCISPFYFKFEY